MARIGNTDLDVFPLALGGNVFGWTADKTTSFAVLDAFADGGGNFIDSADSYSAWVPGHIGGESETIIGEWMKARGNRDKMVIATKVGQLEPVKGTSRAAVRQAVEDSLRRLQVETIDLYYAHIDDQETPLEESAAIFGEIVAEGKVRHVAASNFSPERLQAALDIQQQLGVAPYVALQPHYNLMERTGFEAELRDVVSANGMSTIPYFGLARGFLTGKYRIGGPEIASPRAGGASQYLNERGVRVLAALDQIAEQLGVAQASVALAWLAAQPTVAAPIASASKPEQVAALVAGGNLSLSCADLALLTEASLPEPTAG
jgi:aryl-alcohol dehydrogenase-like predicted oxidoreductase